LAAGAGGGVVDAAGRLDLGAAEVAGETFEDGTALGPLAQATSTVINPNTARRIKNFRLSMPAPSTNFLTPLNRWSLGRFSVLILELASFLEIFSMDLPFIAGLLKCSNFEYKQILNIFLDYHYIMFENGCRKNLFIFKVI